MARNLRAIHNQDYNQQDAAAAAALPKGAFETPKGDWPSLLPHHTLPLPGNGLLHGLQCPGQRSPLGLADQQMHMFGHHHVAGNVESITPAGPLQSTLEPVLGARAVQQRFATIATKGDKMQLAGLLISS